jgi:two-component system, cell cycle sensor histidine kinase and response regulator CckA
MPEHVARGVEGSVTGTILVVDDDPDLRTVAQAALLQLGYTAIETGDPREAMRVVKAQQVDLLLTDVVMPLMKGPELADRIQAISPGTKVVLMSGFATADVGATGRPFLMKPFSFEVLGDMIRRILARRSPFARPGSVAPRSTGGVASPDRVV